jgi:hypothetical protein
MKTENSLSEIMKILQTFTDHIKIPEGIQDKTITLEMENKTIKEILQHLGLSTN